MASKEDDPLFAASAWLDGGSKIAIATVTTTWGSAPRAPGSQMAVRDDGAFVGSVSGGCVENAVIEQALGAIADGKIRNFEFGVANEDAWAVGLACGGTIKVHVAPVTSPEQKTILTKLETARSANRATVLASAMDSNAWRLIYPDEADADAFHLAAREAARSDQSRTAQIEGEEWFLTVDNPPVDFVIVGAVHIAQPLAAMAKIAGFKVRVVDPRPHFASEQRFPGIPLVHAWADEAFAAAPLGPRSAVVALTHDPKLDDPALVAALRSPSFYIGALGSTRTHARRLERLREAGFGDDDLIRIHGPIGLSIGARSPEEIAISILAQVTSELRRR